MAVVERGGLEGILVFEVGFWEIHSFRRLRRRWGRREESGGEEERVSVGEIGGFVVGAWLVVVVVVARWSDGSYAATACPKRFVGSATMPLAEKYSLRSRFRRIGLGAVVKGSFLGKETLKCRLTGALEIFDNRARHLRQIELHSGKLDATRLIPIGIFGY